MNWNMCDIRISLKNLEQEILFWNIKHYVPKIYNMFKLEVSSSKKNVLNTIYWVQNKYSVFDHNTFFSDRVYYL